MEAAEETLTYRDVTGLHRKLLPEDKDKAITDRKGHATETKSDESNYVDLDMKPDGAKTVKVTFTGEGSQLSVVKCDGSKGHDKEGGIMSGDSAEEQLEDTRAAVPGPVPAEPPLETLTKLPTSDQDSETEKRRQAELDPSDCSQHVCSESEELQYTDMYLNSRTESDDGASAVLSDHCGSDTVEDESHYITTHEIQLTELDHDVDYDLGRGTCWDFEDNNLVYSFVDYASFESDETQEGTLIVEGRSQRCSLGGAVVSTEQEDSDLCDSDKCASSDESVCKNQSGDANAGKIHLSIKTSSRAVNEPVSVFDSSTCGYTKPAGDRGHFSFVSSGARAGPLCDRAQYFIPAPGRQHLATKLRRKDINEYSSGASSSISELDDADKEVRNLTAKSFRSLACPYFDAINLSTSSESSMSEYGLNKWSAYVDWNYENVSRGRERSVIAHKTSSATLEMNKTVGSSRHGKSVTGMKAPQTKMYALNKRTTSQQSSSSSKNIEVKDPVQPKQRGVTLNFRCNVEAPAGARRPKCSKKARSSEVTGAVVARSGCEMQYHHTESSGDTHKRAVFASSLLKNVISKKMQFEQERKMERGEICDTYPALSPCFQLKDQDGMKERGQGRGLQRQTSESGSGFNSADDQQVEGSRPGSCEPAEEQSSKAAADAEKTHLEPPTAPLSHSQSSAFNSVREEETKPAQEAEPTSGGDTQTTAKQGLDTSSMLTKLLFVPSCQLSKDRDCTEGSPSRAPVAGAPAAGTPAAGAPAGLQTCEKEIKTGNNGNIPDKDGKEKGGKAPEIKICLRSVKENKGCTLNIANLLTPKISSNTVNTFRAAADAKCHILSASDKIPNFTVRDIRDTKCKFQTPIYHVRDVRKLVKSSYRFVSLDNSESKCSTTAAEKVEEKATKEPVKQLLPSPIVIKCHSVKTNVKAQTAEAKAAEAASHSAAPAASKQLQPDQPDLQPHTDPKATKPRQEKFPGETADRRNEPTIPKQAALEKLKAAVKTMEQLYVFDRNEWKRKTQAPQPITDSHVLSLIAREEQGAEELDATSSDAGKAQDDTGALSIIHVPCSEDTFKTQHSKTFSNRSVLHLGSKARVSIRSVSNPVPQSSALQTASTGTGSSAPGAPLSVKIESAKNGQLERGKVKIIPTNPTAAQACSDSENYLTIPGLGCTNEIQLLHPDPASREVSSNVSRIRTPEQKRSPLIMEYPASSIYHHSGPAAGPQAPQPVLRFSPSVPAASPTPSTGDTVPHTQRKMLLDPTTGHYYLVDTPIQATTKRLFDPETGQYVEVPMPHSPVAPVTPVTPVPLSLSPLALSPGAYAPTYMIYPSFIPSPTLVPQSLCHPEEADGDKVKNGRSPRPETNATGGESAYYSATGEAPQGPLQIPVSLGHVTARGGAASSDRKPVISITTQQGPRIIAPPSFDGTTMSFVVEHR
ncbi:uncharacterized protein C4orf54 homolog [Chelmon rostratus]|uniref:uncharacterized protein C4orf54 homolog n=1 Tax=Chelmon rostratus TaxID=109905 RepID=UPI001BEAB1DF|nr:uncharacterized protein C4orf54 homolog [Chelmon rostratus]